MIGLTQIQEDKLDLISTDMLLLLVVWPVEFSLIQLKLSSLECKLMVCIQNNAEEIIRASQMDLQRLVKKELSLEEL